MTRDLSLSRMYTDRRTELPDNVSLLVAVDYPC